MAKPKPLPPKPPPPLPPPAPPAENSAHEYAMQLMTVRPTVPAPVPQPAQGLAGALEIVGKADRTHLSQWWRDQMAHVEYVVTKRAQMLAAVTEHPNAIFSRLAMIFGAEGKPRDVAANLLGMGEGDFCLHYAREWALGSAEIVGQVSANLVRIALSSNDRYAVKAAVEVINRRGGEEWRPPAQKLEVSGGRSSEANVIDSRNLTFEERQALRAIIERVVTRKTNGGTPQLTSDEDD